MSNKTLVIMIVALLFIFFGAVVFIQMRNNNTEESMNKYSEDKSQSQPNTSDPSEELSQPPVAQPENSSPATSAPVATGECKRNFDENKLQTAKVNIQNRTVEMVVKDFGTIQLEFYNKDAPKTVENFLRLANSGYFDCLTFHRVAKGFVIQGGDPSGNGSGGVSAFGAKFEDELNPETPSYKAGYLKGVLAMANSGPNTNGSQFFIMLGDVSLNHAYTIFGKVTKGLDVVDKIGKVQIVPQMGPEDGAPVKTVVMQSVKITK